MGPLDPENRPDIYDATVNGILHGRTKTLPDRYIDPTLPAGERAARQPVKRTAKSSTRPATTRSCSACSAATTAPGIARALLSPSYKPIDNIDVMFTLLSAVNEARDNGIITGEPQIRADLCENAMDVRVTVPDIAARASILTKGYRSPFRDGGARRTIEYQDFTGMPERPKSGDVVWAGLRLRNNEIGQGSLQIAPEIHIVICC